MTDEKPDAIERALASAKEEYYDWRIHTDEGTVDKMLRSLANAVLEEAARACDVLCEDLAQAGKGFEKDAPGNPRQHFMALASGARDAGKAIRALMRKG